MNYVKEYYERIASGNVVVGKRVRKQYARLVEEMSGDRPYYFDEEAGEHPIQFIEMFCKQSEGTFNKHARVPSALKKKIKVSMCKIFID